MKVIKELTSTNTTAIIYASKHGTTETVARLLAEELNDKAVLISLKENQNPDITQFEIVILGSAIYAGTSRKEMKKFCENNKEVLQQKTIGLFICGMEPNPINRENEIKNAYPESLLQHAKITGFLGGEFLFDKLNFLEKLIVKKVAKVTDSVSAIEKDTIATFAKEIKS